MPKASPTALPAPPAPEFKGLDHIVGQQAAVDWLRKQLQRGQLAHGLLLLGPRGVGKRTLARALVTEHFCEQGSGCGECSSCEALRRSNAAGLVELSCAPGKESIGIAQIKDLQAEMALRAPTARGRVSLLLRADRMTPEAQDALLKTLEEPPPGNYLILTADRPDALFPTIRSRCQRLTLTPLSQKELGEVGARLGLQPQVPLSMAMGCPGNLGALSDPVVAELRKSLLKRLQARNGAGELAGWTQLLFSGQTKGPGKARVELSALRERGRLLLRLLSSMIRDLVVLHVDLERAEIRNQDLLQDLQALASDACWGQPGDILRRIARAHDQLLGNVDPATVLYGVLQPAEPQVGLLRELARP
jgi:DNA polymerase-3 subunit delta'